MVEVTKTTNRTKLLPPETYLARQARELGRNDRMIFFEQQIMVHLSR